MFDAETALSTLQDLIPQPYRSLLILASAVLWVAVFGLKVSLFSMRMTGRAIGWTAGLFRSNPATRPSELLPCASLEIEPELTPLCELICKLLRAADTQLEKGVGASGAVLKAGNLVVSGIGGGELKVVLHGVDQLRLMPSTDHEAILKTATEVRERIMARQLAEAIETSEDQLHEEIGKCKTRTRENLSMREAARDLRRRVSENCQGK